jgi:replicative DNA helicase
MKKIKLNYSNLTPLPSNFLVEQAVLNILLTSPNLIKSSLSSLKINSFYFLPHQLIYEAILELNDKKNSFNLTILVSYLQDKNLLTQIGGMETLIKIISRFENFSDLETYIKILNEKYLRRLIIEFGKEIITLGYVNTISLDEIIEKGFERKVVCKVLRLIKLNEYKRRQAPPGVRVTTRAFGRDWRYPITSQFRA